MLLSLSAWAVNLKGPRGLLSTPNACDPTFDIAHFETLSFPKDAEFSYIGKFFIRRAKNKVAHRN
jgi:hypothetical protein